MSQNKIGVSRKMSIEYPYKQLPCQTQGGFLQTALSTVTRRSRSCSSPVLLRRVTPDRVLAFIVPDPAWIGTDQDLSWRAALKRLAAAVRFRPWPPYFQ